MHFVLSIAIDFINLSKNKMWWNKIFFKRFNFLIDGIILFLEIWFDLILSSLMLCKQLVHMYNVELISIWIWKYIESYCDNLFEICLIFLKKHNVSKQKHGILGTSLEEILSFATKKSMTKCLKQLIINYSNRILFQILGVKNL
jgi:hypothetical protein